LMCASLLREASRVLRNHGGKRNDNLASFRSPSSNLSTVSHFIRSVSFLSFNSVLFTSSTMRSFLSLLPLLSASALASAEIDARSIAQPITQVDEGSSYIVKLECVGCPFRNTDRWSTWATSALDNSLVSTYCRVELPGHPLNRHISSNLHS
jgi:hypothetical protein